MNGLKKQNCRPIAYIGFCADETKRFKYEVHKENWELQDCCYPLAEEEIEESTILEWAKKKYKQLSFLEGELNDYRS